MSHSTPLETAVRRTVEAIPDPRIVIAVGGSMRDARPARRGKRLEPVLHAAFYLEIVHLRGAATCCSHSSGVRTRATGGARW